MKELAGILSDCTGVSMEASAEIVAIMMEYLERRLPEPLASQVKEIMRLVDKSYELCDRTSAPANMLFVKR